jgi:recombinational DNA repair protein RecR
MNQIKILKLKKAIDTWNELQPDNKHSIEAKENYFIVYNKLNKVEGITFREHQLDKLTNRILKQIKEIK